jgi:hypothetical protein
MKPIPKSIKQRTRIVRSGSAFIPCSVAAALGSMLLLSQPACSEGEQVIPAAEPITPSLSVIQQKSGTVEIDIAGPYSLRALQLRLVYDADALRVTKIVAGKDAARLDRLFFSDPQGNGQITMGLSDTRQVPLPARGALFQLQFTAAGSFAVSALKVEDPLGSLEGGAPVKLLSTSGEVTLQ